MKMKVRVTQIKKGDRFFNEYWGREVTATCDSYRLDGSVDDEHYRGRARPKVAECYWDGEQWVRSWWIYEVGVNDGNGAGGIWTEREDRYIHVEREGESA